MIKKQNHPIFSPQVKCMLFIVGQNTNKKIKYYLMYCAVYLRFTILNALYAFLFNSYK